MIWNLLLIIPLPLLVIGSIRLYRYSSQPKDPYTGYVDRGGTQVNFGLGLVCVWLIAGIFGTALQYAATSELRHTVELVDMKRSQRDVLLEQVRDELSPAAFAALMAATPDSDLLVILGNQASDVMVERARLVVALNQEVYELENEQIHRRIDICVYAENPFTPRLFTLPGCPEGV